MARHPDGYGTCVTCGKPLFPDDDSYPSDRCPECWAKMKKKLEEVKKYEWKRRNP